MRSGLPDISSDSRPRCPFPDDRLQMPTGAEFLPKPRILLLHKAINRAVERTGASWDDAADAVHNALCSGELKAEAANGLEIPVSVWRRYTPAEFREAASQGQSVWGYSSRHDEYRNPFVYPMNIDGWLTAAQESEC